MKAIKLPINYTEKYIIPFKAKKKYVCVYDHPTHPIFQPPILTFFIGNYSTLTVWGNHFFQTLAKMASGLKQVLAKIK
jgi:hypothetical protein